MTGMLASVANLQEANIVMQAGADIIDLKNPEQGALGAVDVGTARTIVNQVSRCQVSATVGDLPMQVDLIEQQVKRMASTGVDIIKIGVFDNELPETFLQLLNNFSKNNISIVVVLFADRKPELDYIFSCLGSTKILGVMLDTENKKSGRLTEVADSVYLQKFISMARSLNMMTGLAGSLLDEDIDGLLQLAPDYLGFRTALCHALKRTRGID